MKPIQCQYKGLPSGPNFVRKCLTCSSNDNEAARLRAFALSSSGFSAAFLAIGLSGGDSSELGVVSALGLERSSESSAVLSKTESLTGDSDIVVDDEFPSMYDITAFGSNSLNNKSLGHWEGGWRDTIRRTVLLCVNSKWMSK